jgi:rSAM/selenodomain-associated transferase 1
MRKLSEICAMAVMAKAPRPGRSKTRLVPALSAEHAAEMSAAFLRDVTENIAAAAIQAPIDGLVAYAPAGSEALFEGHLAAGTGLILADGGTPAPPAVQGFGRCLLHAVCVLLDAGYGAACVVNSDSPTLPTEVLVRAAEILAAPGDRAVLGPAEDGGYYLLGVKAAHVHLFEDIAWSTGAVAEQTLERARQIGLEMVLLPGWFDVDDPPSLRRLLDHFAGRGPDRGLAPYAAPATAACLQRIRPEVDAH